MSLQSDLQSLFTGMQDGSKTNTDFCNGIASCIKNYVDTLQYSASSVSGQDSVNQGAFTGSASGTLAITASDISSILIACTDEMWENRSDTEYDGNNALAEALADALDNASGNITWNVTITGETIVPGSPPVTISPVTDDGEVSAIFNSTRLLNKLKQVFTTMKSMTSGGDDYFATNLATEVMYYFTSATSTVQGTVDGGLAGSTGSGIIS